MKKILMICALAGFALRAQATPLGYFTFTGNGNWSNAANWDIYGIPPATLSNGSTIAISGTAIMDVNESVLSGASFVINAGNTLTVKTGNTLTLGGQLDNSGTLIINGIIGVDGALNNVSSGTVTNNGTVKGIGTITPNASFTNAAGSHIAPGNSAGTLTITGTFDVSNANLDIEVGGTGAGASDRLAVSGTAKVTNAILNVTQLGGYTPVNGDVITFLTSPNVVGGFAVKNYPASFYSNNSGNVSRGLIFSATPLAMKLGTFNARTTTAGRNELTWSTATETEGYTFSIERSTNGREFNEAGIVTGKGTPSTYSFYDNEAASPVNYYRLKVGEATGDVTYSNIAVVRNAGGSNGSIIIAPVPARDYLTITSTTVALKGSIATLSDMQGRTVHQFTMDAVTTISTANWPAGIYSLRLADGTAVKMIKE